MQGQRYSKMLEKKSQINQEKASLWRKKEKKTQKNQEKARVWRKREKEKKE